MSAQKALHRTAQNGNKPVPARVLLPRREDVRVLWGGIFFSILFTAAIWMLGGRLDDVALLPDRGAAWYYWQLPTATVWSRVSAWGFYLIHQVTLWGLIYYAQTQRPRRYRTNLHVVNWVALGTNAFFIFLHLIQTHIWYDGLAQDVSIFSSQGSVIVLLVWVLLMENRRRGLVWGKPAPISKQVVYFARKYHGYFFAWAVVFTFWFHPMVSTSGHLIGFLYTFLLLVQSSLFYTPVHANRWWTFALEFIVLVHGALVAVMQGNGMWPMFLFGFAGITVITQMHGLGLSLRTRLLILFGFLGSALWVYSGRGLVQMNEIIRIPVIDYIAVLLLAGIFWSVLWIVRQVKSLQQSQ